MIQSILYNLLTLKSVLSPVMKPGRPQYLLSTENQTLNMTCAVQTHVLGNFLIKFKWW